MSATDVNTDSTLLPAQGGEYLTFRLGEAEYGLGILWVQEIRSYEKTHPILDAPLFIKGIINLRGVVVPIVDLRLKLGCDAQYNFFTVVVVLKVRGRTIGAVVDSVSDVLEFQGDQIRPIEQPSEEEKRRCGAGTVSVGERVFFLMDIEALMTSPDTWPHLVPN